MKLNEDSLKNLNKLELSELLKTKDSLSEKRFEYKFLIPIEIFPEIAEFLKEDYHCLTHNGSSIFIYENTYFDTKDFFFFNQHRVGKANRIKIRIRRYKTGVKDSYIECKKKRNGIFSEKEREKICKNTDFFKESEFLDSKVVRKNIAKYEIELKKLKNVLNIKYNRIFFMSHDLKSRVSIDFDLISTRPKNPSLTVFQNHLILEIKEKTIPKKLMKYLRKTHKIRQVSFSKYCISLCLLYKELKSNKWKNTLKLRSLDIDSLKFQQAY